LTKRSWQRWNRRRRQKRRAASCCKQPDLLENLAQLGRGREESKFKELNLEWQQKENMSLHLDVCEQQNHIAATTSIRLFFSFAENCPKKKRY